LRHRRGNQHQCALCKAKAHEAPATTGATVLNISRPIMTNSNRLDGTFNDAAGKVQDAVGGLTGDLDLQAEGKLRQLAGKTQAKYGDSVDQVAEATRNNPLGALLIAAGVGFLLGRLL
jgi:uncharacterized protein YjbJ (UPF0337 family)